jgi:Putative amidoligase enzyme.
MRFDNNRLWGVEIEFLDTVNREDVARKMTEKGVLCYVEGYNHTTRGHWKVVTDASCGYELVSPPLKGEEGFRQLKIACEVLNELGAKVDKRCGLHVHHDANDFTVDTFKRVLCSV